MTEGGPPESVRKSVRRLVESGLANPQTLRPCPRAEIRALEATVGQSLPTSYRVFLEIAGGGAGDFFVGTDWEFPKLPQLQQRAAGLMGRSNPATRLPPTAFVFAMHQGYQLLYFDTRDGDDPPIWSYTEDDPEPQQVFPTFSAWLAQAVEDEIG